MAWRPMNQGPLARQELSLPFDGTFFFSFPPFLAFLCIFLLLSIFLFLFAVFFFFRVLAALTKNLVGSLEGCKKQCQAGMLLHPYKAPPGEHAAHAAWRCLHRRRGVDVTSPRNRLTSSRKERGEGAWEEMQYAESLFAGEILRIRPELGVVYTGLKS